MDPTADPAGNPPHDGTLRSPGREESGRPKNPARNRRAAARPGTQEVWSRAVAACPSSTCLFPSPRRTCSILFQPNPRATRKSSPAKRSGVRQNKCGATQPMQEPAGSCKAATVRRSGDESRRTHNTSVQGSKKFLRAVDIAGRRVRENAHLCRGSNPLAVVLFAE